MSLPLRPIFRLGGSILAFGLALSLTSPAHSGRVDNNQPSYKMSVEDMTMLGGKNEL